MEASSRRNFISKGSSLAALSSLGLLAACKKPGEAAGSEKSGEPQGVDKAASSKKKFQWKLVTTWPPHFPVMGEGVERLAQRINELSSGQLKIQVYGGGELVPAMETFDAVSRGSVEMGHSSSYYWIGKTPASVFFTTVPFGMSAQQMNSWLISGGGLELWEELYSIFNLIPIPCGNTGMQMGGWFNREIRSVTDFNGLKMRMPGLGGKVISKLGATAILSPASEIYTNLERGVLDAAEWVGPFHDYTMGFPKIAKYYYYPGWHEPGPTLELTINKEKWTELPDQLKAVVRCSAAEVNAWMLSRFEHENFKFLQKIREEGKVQVLPFPKDVIDRLREVSSQVMEEFVAADPFAKKVYESYKSFQTNIMQWDTIGELAYFKP